MGSTTIHPFPELRALAEEEARAFASAWAGEFAAAWLAWDTLDPDTREKRIRTHLSLLCDLSRPASRDAVARLVAARLSIPVECFAPSLWRMAATVWAFSAMSDCSGGVKNVGVWFIPTPGSTAKSIHSVPSLVGITDPAEALALIVRHLWPEESP